MWDTVDRGFDVVGDEASRNGPAAGSFVDPRILRLHSPRPDLVRGLFAALLVQPDVVRVRHQLKPTGGLLRAEVTWSSSDGAGRLASHLKRRGYQAALNPIVRDDRFDQRFLDQNIIRFPLELGRSLPTSRFVAGGEKVWVAGAGWREELIPSRRKLCVATTDPARLTEVVAAVLAHPAAYGARTNIDEGHQASVFGRIVFVEEQPAGQMCRQLEEDCPDVNPLVQDDEWFAQFRGR